MSLREIARWIGVGLLLAIAAWLGVPSRVHAASNQAANLAFNNLAKVADAARQARTQRRRLSRIELQALMGDMTWNAGRLHYIYGTFYFHGEWTVRASPAIDASPDRWRYANALEPVPPFFWLDEHSMFVAQD